MDEQSSLEHDTGQLFSNLWGSYDTQLFEESVQLFSTRLYLARFDATWFNGKACLDAGCGGGRNSIAMARLGSKKVVGIDVGEEGLANARQRSQGLSNVKFLCASILDIPFEDGTFDMVWCAGVLMITVDADRALEELTRVLKKDGYLYMLVYATGGMRWPLIQQLRPLAAQVGKLAVERAIQSADLPANKRRTFLDDLFCPRLDFYHWDRLDRMLKNRGFYGVRRWGPECRLDHEANLESYRADLEALSSVFSSGDREEFGEARRLFRAGHKTILATIDSIHWFEDAVRRGEVSSDIAMNQVIGQGHHRLLALKG